MTGLPDTKSPCAAPPPPALLQAVAEFNDGRYFQCHDTLEALWLADVSPVRDFYKGLIQIAAGLYHFENGNARGCSKLLARGTGYVERFAPRCQGLDVAGLLAMTRAALAWCAKASPGAALPAHLVPRMALTAD
ncbi:DUF309 domain-containing protein [Solidesulfovibrio sp.]